MRQFELLILLTFSLIKLIYSQCNPGEFYHDNTCYLFSRVPLFFFDGEEACEKLGYTLLIINSAFENNFVRDKATNIWGKGAAFRFGLQNVNNIWQWVDGTNLTYSNWGPGEPANNLTCANFDIASGTWHDYYCDAMSMFVCSGPPSNNRTTSLAPQSTVSHGIEKCTYLDNNGWIYPENGLCYTFIHNYQDDKFVNCNGSIHSVQEDEFVRDFAMDFFLSQSWCFDEEQALVMYHIGSLTGALNNDTHFWIDGEPFDYYHGNITQYRLIWGDSYVYVIGIVNPATLAIDWKRWEDSYFDNVPQSCQYFLCKSS